MQLASGSNSRESKSGPTTLVQFLRSCGIEQVIGKREGLRSSYGIPDQLTEQRRG